MTAKKTGTNKSKTTIADRIAKHPMYEPSDLKYLRDKGYSDQEILAFWDRDHGLGCKPVAHRITDTGPKAVAVKAGPEHRDPVEPANALQDLVQDCMSPQAAAVIAMNLRGVKVKDEGVNREVGWFADTIRNILGDQYKSLCEEAGIK